MISAATVEEATAPVEDIVDGGDSATATMTNAATATLHDAATNFTTTTLLGNNHDGYDEIVQVDLPFWERIISGPTQWTTMDKIGFAILIMIAMELLKQICSVTGRWLQTKRIPIGGKHLDVLSRTDRLYISISKAQTGPFVYFLLRYCFTEQHIVWEFSKVSLTLNNTLVTLPALFIVYDFFYTILHWFLHIRAIYPYIHKHHHRQKAPSRATDDAVNVHPIEFTLGEYNHLWTIYIWCHVFNMEIHIIGVLLFLGIGGIFAGWNHTRYDITWNIFGVSIFDSKAHDVHHRIPQSNYGQYTMFWDTVFGTYRPYNQNKSNPTNQVE